MSVLLFYPSNQRSVQIETVLLELNRRDVRVALLTTCERGPLHTYLEEMGIPAMAHPVSGRRSALRYLRQVRNLAAVCRRMQVKVVFSNLQHANFIAVLAQFFTRSKVIVFRHHFKFAFPGDRLNLPRSRVEQTFDFVINSLAKVIVVPSDGVRDGMMRVERVSPRRVVVVPYIYDFSAYESPDSSCVEALRSEHDARLLTVICGRHIPFKRYEIAIAAASELIREGLDIQMLVLGEGPDTDRLRQQAAESGAAGRFHFYGQRDDVQNYLAAADILIHPSLTEASSNVVKEMALVRRSAVVCSGVGDFDEYIHHGRTGFVVPRVTDGSDIADILRSIYGDEERLEEIGLAARKVVTERFGVLDRRVEPYLELAGNVASSRR